MSRKDGGNFAVDVTMLKEPYNPLLDPHLKQHYSNQIWIKPLQDQGLVTKDNKVLELTKEVFYLLHRLFSYVLSTSPVI